jgi:hypothetical protein
MAAMPTRTAIVVSVLAALIASPALAGGVFTGTFGTEKFKSKKRFASCSFFRAYGLFSATGVKANRKKQTGTIVGGTAPDFTVPGAAFPMVLENPTGSFTSGPPPTPPTWTGYGPQLGGDFTVTLTGYKKGKVSGSVTGTMQPAIGGAAGPLTVNATFTVKCLVQ